MKSDIISDDQLSTKNENQNYTSDTTNENQSRVLSISSGNWVIVLLALIEGFIVWLTMKLHALTAMR